MEFRNYSHMVITLPHMTMEEVKHMLDKELATTRRKAVVLRLHQRYRAMETAAQRRELVKELGE